MQKTIITIILVIVGLFVVSRLQSFVKNNASAPAVTPQDETTEYMASTTNSDTIQNISDDLSATSTNALLDSEATSTGF